jgi:hypothetical protein
MQQAPNSSQNIESPVLPGKVLTNQDYADRTLLLLNGLSKDGRVVDLKCLNEKLYNVGTSLEALLIFLNNPDKIKEMSLLDAKKLRDATYAAIEVLRPKRVVEFKPEFESEMRKACKDIYDAIST